MPTNTFTGDNASNTIDGTADDDAIYGLGGADTLRGLAGDDWLDGGTGADAMFGGAGDDTYIVDTTSDSVTELAGQGNDTVRAAVSWVLGANVENLVLTGSAAINGTGNALDNTMTGNGAANILSGAAGNDWLDGGAGDDSLLGGAGNDTYVVDSTGDRITENAFEGRDTVRASISWVLTDNIENLVLTGSDAIDGLGNSLGNAITGNDADNTLQGFDGIDTLDGGLGADTLIGGLGSDTLVVDNIGDVVIENANEGIDTVRSTISWVLGDNLENLTLDGTDAIDGTGNELDNALNGNAAANVLIGGDGADTLDGEGGGDTLEGGLGDDTYILAGADDVVTERAGEGTDTIIAGFSITLGDHVENLTLTGESAIDGTGNDLANVLTGNSGANVLTGGAGDDTYVVGDGDSTVELAGGGTDAVRSAVTWTLSDNVEALVLTGALAIDGTGNALDNAITGNDLANVIDGAAGADTMTGLGGDDTYIVDDAGDVVVEATIGGRDTVRAGVSYALSANVENLTLTGAAAINATGNGGTNVIRGNAAANVIDGGAGADDLDGGEGSDLYVISAIHDHVGSEIRDTGTTGTDELRITATAAGMVLLGARESGLERIVIGTGTGAVADTSGTDAIAVNASRATAGLTMIGNAGANFLTGSNHADIIDGGAGIDRMAGGGGNDVFIVDSSMDAVREGSNAGTDTVLSSATFKLGANIEILTLTGAAAIDGTGNALGNTITGNGSANRIDGGKGDDVIDGAGGDDTLIGGAGSDRLTGGAGADTFRFDSARAGTGVDVITDFSAAQGDRIALTLGQFKGFASIGSITADQFWSGEGVFYAHDASDRIIYNRANGDIWYDADGSGTRYAAVLLASVGEGTHPALTSADFVVI